MATTPTPTPETPKPEVQTKTVQKTVFDLLAFDDVTLVKTVVLPDAPKSIEEALAQVGNDAAKLLSVIHDGLIERAVENAKKEMAGFRVLGEDGEPGEEYTGKFADEAKGKLINAAILSMAKMLGYAKELPKEKKAAIKEQAVAFLRSNPEMLKSIQG